MKNSNTQMVFIRHGHTEWNLTNRFTGWSDIPLAEKGLDEARQIGQRLLTEGFNFDEAHLSVLFRTRQALDAILAAAYHPEIPIYTSWRLNERHYGSLQGLNKQEIFNNWGEQQSYQWWRGYEAEPPPLSSDDPRHPRFDHLYKDLKPSLLPGSESLAQCVARLQPYWENVLHPAIKKGKRLIIVSHGNTLRSLRMLVEKINPIDIEKVEIPFDVAYVYTFNKKTQLTQFEQLEPAPQVIHEH